MVRWELPWFVVFGFVALAIDFAFFNLLSLSPISIIASNLISVTLANVFLFLAHLKVSFRHVTVRSRSLTAQKFALVATATIAANYALVYLGLSLFDVVDVGGANLVKFGSIATMLGFRFLALKFFVYTEIRTQQGEEHRTNDKGPRLVTGDLPSEI